MRKNRLDTFIGKDKRIRKGIKTVKSTKKMQKKAWQIIGKERRRKGVKSVKSTSKKVGHGWTLSLERKKGEEKAYKA